MSKLDTVEVETLTTESNAEVVQEKSRQLTCLLDFLSSAGSKAFDNLDTGTQQFTLQLLHKVNADPAKYIAPINWAAA